MNRSIRWFGILLVIFVFCSQCFVSRAFAQPAQPPVQPADLDDLPPGVLPDAWYYQNESGEWVRLLVDRVKEFENYLRAKTDPTPAVLPTFRLEDILLELTLEDKLVRIQGTVSGELEQASEKWFEVPVALSNVQVLPSEEGVLSRMVPATGSGYVWRHGPAAPGRLSHSFVAVSNITPSTDGGSVRLDLPNSPSRIRFPLSPADWDITVSGSGGEVVEPRLDEKSYIIRVPGGAAVIAWTRKAATDSVQATEVNSQLRVSLDSSKSEFTVNCRMTLRSPRRLGGRAFTVELPSDCVWKSRLSTTALLTGYRLIPVLDSPRLQTIEIDESISQSEFEVILEWTGKLSQDDGSVSIELPRVRDTNRNSGIVTISLNRSQSLLWEPQGGILYSRISSTDASDIATNNFYIQDASLVLKCRIAKEKSLPDIQADYRIQLLADRILLTSIVEFNEDVRNLPFLQWEGRGWSVINAVVLSSGKQLIGNQQTKPGDESVIVPIPIADLNDAIETVTTPGVADAIVGKRVLVQCVRPIDLSGSLLSSEKTMPIDIELEMPVISWLDELTQSRRTWSPAGVSQLESSVFQIRSQDPSYEVGAGSAKDSTIKSLLDSLSGDFRLMPSTRFNVRSKITGANRGDQTKQSWKLTLKPLLPEIEANETIRIMNGRGVTGFEQEWLLTSLGGFPERLLMALPRDWNKSNSVSSDEVDDVVKLDSPSFELALNGSLLEKLEPVTEEDLSILNFRLPACKMGHEWFYVSIPDFIRSQVSEDTPSLLTLRKIQNADEFKAADGNTKAIDYQFAILESGISKSQIQRQSCVCLLLAEPERRLVVNDVVYSTSSSEIRIGNEIWKQTRLDLPFDSTRLSGFLVARNFDETTPVRLEKAWVQSVVQNDNVRHRVVFRVHTREATIRLRSKAPFTQDVEVSVNGIQSTADRISDDGSELVVTLNVGVENANDDGAAINSQTIKESPPAVVELFYWEKLAGNFWQVLNLPRIDVVGQGDLSAPVFWQVLTPATEHVLTSSENLANQNEWAWSRFWFSRFDSRSQSDMESLIGASVQPPLELPLIQHSISAVDSSQSRWVYLVPFYVVWFPIGCATILFSALLFHLQWMRNPWVLLGFVTLLIWLGFWWLDGMILLSQVVLATGSFTFVAMMISWMFDRSSRRRTVLAGRGTTIGTLPQKSNGKSDSKIDSKQELSGNPIDSLPTTISPNMEIVRGASHDVDRNVPATDALNGGSSVRGTVR